MSHIVTITTEVRDPVAVSAACRRLGLPAPVLGTAKLFTSEAAGLLVQLPEWKYPIACQTSLGKLHYDNFGERWGKQPALDAFLQAYAVEKATLEARKQGHSVSERALTSGAIQLSIQVQGSAA